MQLIQSGPTKVALPKWPYQSGPTKTGLRKIMKNIYISMVAILAFSVGTIHAINAINAINAQEGKQLNFMNKQLSEQLLNQTIIKSNNY
jgi:hypothetical protein